LTNCSGEIGNWLVGLSLLKLLPGVISLVESLQVE
jgi:hypothetical protein